MKKTSKRKITTAMAPVLKTMKLPHGYQLTVRKHKAPKHRKK